MSAEGQAEAKLKVAGAEAQAIQLISQAIGANGSPTQYLIAQKYLESLNQIAQNSNKTIFLPYESSGVMGALGSMKELWATGRGYKSAGPRLSLPNEKHERALKLA